MQKVNFKTQIKQINGKNYTDYTLRKNNIYLFIVGLFIISATILLAPNVLAQENTTSTPSHISTSTPIITSNSIISTTTLKETKSETNNNTTTTTLTPSTTLEIIIPTSTIVTSTNAIATSTLSSTSTTNINTSTLSSTSTTEINSSTINNSNSNTTSTPSSTLDIATTSSSTTSTVENNNTTSTPDNTTTGNSQTNDNQNFISETKINESANKILNYLKSQQDISGKIIDGNTTDWAIMSFGANGQYASDIKQLNGKSLLDYEKTYSLNASSDLNPCTSYPRHIMSLLSAGVQKTDSAITDLKDQIYNNCYSNNLYGLDGINDDVFGLIALLSLDVSSSENIIRDQIAEIEKWQLSNGAFSWPDWYNPSQKVAGKDITGVAINALQYAKIKGANIDNSSIINAKIYLKSSQHEDGGWGDYGSTDIMTTGWVLMGINSLEENQSEWINDQGNNPWNPLINKLSDDGYYESAWAPGTVDWFAMKYAVPALLGKSWPIILEPIVKNFSQGSSYNYGGGGSSSNNIETLDSPTTTPSSTLKIVEDLLTSTSTPTSTLATSSTLEMNTSSEKIVDNTTTTVILSETKDLSSQMFEGRAGSSPLPPTDQNDSTTPIANRDPNLNVGTIEQLSHENDEQLLSSSNTNDQNSNPTNEHLIDSLPLDTPTRNTARKIMGISGGGALVVGLYVGFKLLKNLV